MTTTRIYHRIDTETNWSTAIAASAGKLAKGEIGILTYTSGSMQGAIGRLGVSDTPTAWSACPTIFSGTISPGAAEPVFSEPVIYEAPATTPATGSTLSWDSAASRWTVDDEVVNLDAYPSANGTVIWNQSLGKFQVGAAVSAVELDGGEYTV
jgi:hypothetical protein